MDAHSEIQKQKGESDTELTRKMGEQAVTAFLNHLLAAHGIPPVSGPFVSLAGHMIFGKKFNRLKEIFDAYESENPGLLNKLLLENPEFTTATIQHAIDDDENAKIPFYRRLAVNEAAGRIPEEIKIACLRTARDLTVVQIQRAREVYLRSKAKIIGPPKDQDLRLTNLTNELPESDLQSLLRSAIVMYSGVGLNVQGAPQLVFTGYGALFVEAVHSVGQLSVSTLQIPHLGSRSQIAKGQFHCFFHSEDTGADELARQISKQMVVHDYIATHHRLYDLHRAYDFELPLLGIPVYLLLGDRRLDENVITQYNYLFKRRGIAFKIFGEGTQESATHLYDELKATEAFYASKNDVPEICDKIVATIERAQNH